MSNSRSNPKNPVNYIPEAFDPLAIRVAMNPTEAAEHARLVAFEQGYNDGLEQARSMVEMATDDSNKRVRRALAALCEAVDLFDQRQTVALADVEDAIVAAAFKIAEALIQHELAASSTPGADAIARAMKLVPERIDVIARLHPNDAETLNLDQVSTTTRTVRVIADPSVELGGCIVEAGELTIDAQISTVLENVRVAMGLQDLHTPASVAAGSDPTSSRTTSSEAPLQ